MRVPSAGDSIPPRPRPSRRSTDEDNMAQDAKKLKAIVEKHFNTYDVRWDDDTYAFFVHIYDSDYGDKFEACRLELKKLDYIPKIVMEKGEHVLYVQEVPAQKFRGKVTNLVMFILTIISTIWAGAVLWAPFEGFVPDTIPKMMEVFIKPQYMAYGALYFALPLLLILGVHEFGHYFMAKRHGVNASLPFFIPIPPIIGPLGTFGAFISLREPIPNKKALLQIGAAGPIAGFIVAIPVTLIGLYLTAQDPIYAPGIGGQAMLIKEPLLFWLFTKVIEVPADATLHPVAFAGWVGLLVTAFNLLPAGQLDGGHIVRALFGNRAKWLSYAVIFGLFILAFVTSFFTWALFAFLILLMGARHPPPLNDISPLKHIDKIIGVACALIMVFCFHPFPLAIEEPFDTTYNVEMLPDSTFKTAFPGQNTVFYINVTNTGNTQETYLIEYEALPLDTSLYSDVIMQDLTNFSVIQAGEIIVDGWTVNTPTNTTLTLEKKETTTLLLEINSTSSLALGSGLAVKVRVSSQEEEKIVEECTHYVRLNTFGFQASVSQGETINTAYYTLVVTNPKDTQLHVLFTYKIIREDAPTRGWAVDLNRTDWLIPPGGKASLNVYVMAPVEVFKGNTVVVRVYATDTDTGEMAMTDLTTTVEKTHIIDAR